VSWEWTPKGPNTDGSEVKMVGRVHSFWTRENGEKMATLEPIDSPWTHHEKVAILKKEESPIEKYWIEYREKTIEAIEVVKVGWFGKLFERLVEKKPQTLWLCGNGGSATVCNHMAVEAVTVSDFPCRVMSLCEDGAMLTAMGNDYGVVNLFSMQLDKLAASGDWLWLFSGSGTSKNLVEAAKTAKGMSMEVYAFTGPRKKGDSREHLAEVVDDCLIMEEERQTELEMLFFWLMHGVAYYFAD
jgi:phosphoheptose isomerase